MRPILALTAWVFALTVSCLQAEEDLLEMDLAQLLQIRVSTATRHSQSVASVPGSVFVLRQRDFRERGYRHLSQVLRDLPGIDLHQHSSAQPGNRIAIRGLVGNNKFVIMQDGVRIGGPAGEPMTVADNFPLQHIAQIEIVLGAASAIYGADAVTGVINLITDTNDEDRQLTLAGNSNDARAAAFFVTAAHAGWRWQAWGDRHERRDNSEYVRFNARDFPLNDLRDFGSNVVVSAAEREPYLGEENFHSLGAQLRYEDSFQFGWHRQHSAIPSYTGYRPDYTEFKGDWIETVDVVFARQRWALGGGELDVRLDYARDEVDPDSRFVNIFTGFGDGFKYSNSERRGAEIQYGRALNKHDHVLVGVVSEQFHTIPKTADLPQPYDTGRSADAQGQFYFGTNSSLPIQLFDLRYQNDGAFVQYQRAWNPSWTSLLGYRHDRNSEFGNVNTPRAALLYQTDANWQAHLSYSEAFLAPAPKYAYEHYGSFSGEQDAQGRYLSYFMHVPNPGLQPETLRSTELGWRLDLTPNWALSGALYHSQLQGLIGVEQMTVADSDFIPGGYIFNTQRNANSDSATVTGLDQWLEYRAGRWRAFLALSLTKGELQRADGNQALPYVSPHKLRLGLSGPVLNNWFASISVQANNAFSVQENPGLTEGARVPGYVVAQGQLSYQNILPDTDLSLAIDNIFDTHYYNGGNGTQFEFAAVPQDGRQWLLSLRYHGF